jgi:predicted pyridoxine 5'-phosphate oxidase superfamily flavin-nucleotide-binding protein
LWAFFLAEGWKRCHPGILLDDFRHTLWDAHCIFMTKIPQEIQEFIKGKMAWVATASTDGMPNSTPKGSVQVIDDSHLVFADLFSRKTRENLKVNTKVAVTVVDEKTYKGYQLKGVAELLTTGHIFEQVAEQLKKAPMKLPPVNYVVRITVDSIYDQSVGPDAGKQIA